MALPAGPATLVGHLRGHPVYIDGDGLFAHLGGREIKVVECTLCGAMEFDGDDVKLDDHSICHTCSDAIMNLKHYKHSRRYVTWPNEENDHPRSNRKPIKPGLRRRVHERDYYACRYCGARQKLVLDHLVPVSRGGANTLDNLVTACAPCNARKLDRTIEEAGLTLHPTETFAHG